MEDPLFAIRRLVNTPKVLSASMPGAVETQLNQYFLATGDASFMLFTGPSSPAFPYQPSLSNPKFSAQGAVARTARNPFDNGRDWGALYMANLCPCKRQHAP
jgi:hypothetical protein